MGSPSRFAGFPFLVLAVLALPFFGCQSVDRGQAEVVLTAQVLELVPDGRVYPHDLATDRATSVQDAWLFEKELLIQDNYGRFTSLNRGDLGARWYYADLPGRVDYPPAVGPVSVGLVSGGYLYEVERAHGNPMHAHAVRFVPSAAPALSDSTAYFPALSAAEGNQTLLTMNLATGLLGWGLSTRGSVTGSPVVHAAATRDFLYAVTDRGGVFAFPAESAAATAPVPAWSVGVHGGVTVEMAVEDDLIFIGTDYGELWALDRVTGATAWVCYAGGRVLRRAWAAGDQVYFVNPQGFHAVSRAEGKQLWAVPVDGEFVVRRGDVVYLRTGDGVVHAVSTVNGEILRSVAFPKTVKFLPNNLDSMVYLVTDKGLLMAVGTRLP